MREGGAGSPETNQEAAAARRWVPMRPEGVNPGLPYAPSPSGIQATVGAEPETGHSMPNGTAPLPCPIKWQVPRAAPGLGPLAPAAKTDLDPKGPEAVRRHVGYRSSPGRREWWAKIDRK
jgi:hypothetical protein